MVVLPIEGSKASYINRTEPRTSKTWFLAGSMLPNEEPLDAAVRELFLESGLTLTVDDLTLLSGNHVRVPLHAGKY
jgi:ADP-ribose pyrophosphatase YjhB (NUDIX family)